MEGSSSNTNIPKWLSMWSENPTAWNDWLYIIPWSLCCLHVQKPRREFVTREKKKKTHISKSPGSFNEHNVCGCYVVNLAVLASVVGIPLLLQALPLWSPHLGHFWDGFQTEDMELKSHQALGSPTMRPSPIGIGPEFAKWINTFQFPVLSVSYPRRIRNSLWVEVSLKERPKLVKCYNWLSTFKAGLNSRGGNRERPAVLWVKHHLSPGGPCQHILYLPQGLLQCLPVWWCWDRLANSPKSLFHA